MCCPVRSLWLTILVWFLVNTHGQHLASTKQTFLSFHLLDDKRELADTLYHTAQSRIHLGIQPCISYQTHNPSLSFFWGLIPFICRDINIERCNKNSQMWRECVFSMKSSRQTTKKNSFLSTNTHYLGFAWAPSTIKVTTEALKFCKRVFIFVSVLLGNFYCLFRHLTVIPDIFVITAVVK